MANKAQLAGGVGYEITQAGARQPGKRDPFQKYFGLGCAGGAAACKTDDPRVSRADTFLTDLLNTSISCEKEDPPISTVRASLPGLVRIQEVRLSSSLPSSNLEPAENKRVFGQKLTTHPLLTVLTSTLLLDVQKAGRRATLEAPFCSNIAATPSMPG